MRHSRALRDFLTAAALLAAALFLAVGSEQAIRRGDRLVGQALAAAALLLALGVSLIFVPRIARRIDFASWRLPFTFSVTRQGGGFILVVFLLSLAAVNTGNNLLFLLLAVMLSAIVSSGITARRSLRGVTVSLEIPENVFAGERVPVQVSLHNRKRWFPAFSILVEDIQAGPRGGKPRRFRPPFRSRPGLRDAADCDRAVLRHPAYFPIVRARDARSELVTQHFPYRGRYSVRGFRLSTRFPFGFFSRGERVAAEGEILVFPRPGQVSAQVHLLPFLPGTSEGTRIGQGESLYAIRDYVAGDPARHVDWKATARTGSLMTREFARQEEMKLCVILDARRHAAGGEDTPERFERAVSHAAGLFRHFAQQGAELELLTQRFHVPRGSGFEHMNRIMRALAVVELEDYEPGAPSELTHEYAGAADAGRLEEIFSEKVFKILITSRPRGGFPSLVWRSSHVIYFDEL